MVSIWPWKRDETSPASFEKTLSTLSNKIKNAVAKLDTLRQRARRFNALWMLYSSFAYLLYAIILALVVGWENWGLVEIGLVVGGPVLIYAVRLGLVTYYNYRTSKVQSHLDELQKQRDATIEKLKTATKYNTTQELLKKYGDSPGNKLVSASGGRSAFKDKDSGISGGGRTSFVPPPTANIHGKSGPGSLSDIPQQPSPLSQPPLEENLTLSPNSAGSSLRKPSSLSQNSAEFAPNAFPAPPQYAQSRENPQWYDRLMDVLLGEDESLPRNRLALICKKCRLVNGQAHPGAKRPEDVGKWRCFGCGAWNGDEMEATKIIANVKEEVNSEAGKPVSEWKVRAVLEEDQLDDGNDLAATKDGEESDTTQYSGNEGGASHSEILLTPVKEPEAPKRKSGRPKGSKNAKKYDQ